MKTEHLQFLACPYCSGNLEISSIYRREGDIIKSGNLCCVVCKKTYEIVNYIPRFVPSCNYADSFGLEWLKHARTQYDSYSGVSDSEDRFFNETQWPRDLRGQHILEVGSGSGRFTEQAASTGAFVVSMDYSCAVEANYASNGSKPNVMIVQGDIYSMPFKKSLFDKLFCFGVLQHTPDVRKSFMSLPPFLKPGGGELVVDVYKKTLLTFFSTKYYVRPITKRMNPDKLSRFIRSYVDFMWPLCSVIREIPKIGSTLNWMLLVADSSRCTRSKWHSNLDGDMLKEWTYLTTFDLLSPRYDQPQRIKTVQRWFKDAGLIDIKVADGYNGIEGCGKRS